jgi:hypothetical protein
MAINVEDPKVIEAAAEQLHQDADEVAARLGAELDSAVDKLMTRAESIVGRLEALSARWEAIAEKLNGAQVTATLTLGQSKGD